jgi:hypothetical protein
MFEQVSRKNTKSKEDIRIQKFQVLNFANFAWKTGKITCSHNENYDFACFPGKTGEIYTLDSILLWFLVLSIPKMVIVRDLDHPRMTIIWCFLTFNMSEHLLSVRTSVLTCSNVKKYQIVGSQKI